MNNTKKCEFTVACESGNMDLIKEVHKQVKNIPSDIKQECLEIACSCNNNSVVKYILKNLDKGDLDKEACVRIATQKGYVNIITSLLSDSFKLNSHI